MDALGFSTGLGIRQRRFATGAPTPTPTPTYSAEASALFARMTAAPDATRKGHIDTLIVALKTAGVWARLDCLYLLAAHDAQAARLNWRGASFTSGEVSAPAFTLDRGYAGNGVNSYLDTDFNPSTAPSPGFTLNSAHVGVWSRTDIVSVYDIGAVAGTASFALNCRSSSANTQRGTANSGSYFNGGASADSLGHFVLTRTASNVAQHYKNGAASGAASAAASVAIPNADLRIGSVDAANFSPRQFAAAHIGGGLTGGEVASLHSALAAYMTAVGA